MLNKYGHSTLLILLWTRGQCVEQCACLPHRLCCWYRIISLDTCTSKTNDPLSHYPFYGHRKYSAYILLELVHCSLMGRLSHQVQLHLVHLRKESVEYQADKVLQGFRAHRLKCHQPYCSVLIILCQWWLK